MKKIILIIVVITLVFLFLVKFHEKEKKLFDVNDIYSVEIINNSDQALYVVGQKTHAYLNHHGSIIFCFYVDEKQKEFPISIYDGDLVKMKGSHEECNPMFLMEYNKIPVLKEGKGFVLTVANGNEFILKAGEMDQENAKRFFDITRGKEK